MKKLTAFLLVCALLAPILALAEADPDVEYFDFGDFYMPLDPDIAYTGLEEKEDGEIWFTLYPAFDVGGDTITRLEVAWNKEIISISDMTESDLEDYRAMIEEDMAPTLEESFGDYGATVTDFYVPNIEISSINGRDVLVYAEITEFTLYGKDLTIYSLTVIASGSFGSYVFRGTATSIDLMNTYLVPLLDGIIWSD